MGENPVRHLSEAFARKGFLVEVRVLINDTMGVLATGRYLDASTMVGVILGTGAMVGNTLLAAGLRQCRLSSIECRWG